MPEQLADTLGIHTSAAVAAPLGLRHETGFLPNFCRGELVWHVIVLAEMLAIVATIITPPISTSMLNDVFLVSLFLQWIALSSVTVLCLLRPYLNRLPERRAILMAYMILLCMTWLVGEFTLWLLSTTDRLPTARPEWYGYFHAQNLTVSAIVNALALRYFLARHKLRQTTMREERARAEIMKYRIRPHFLFNSMNIIASLTQRAPVRAETAIEDMADLFRLMLDDSKDLMPVHTEISVARKYIKLEKLRLEQRLNVNWKIGSIPRTAKTPVLMLQLLLENAIHNGIEQLAEGGDISVVIDMGDEDTLAIAVDNPVAEETTTTRHSDYMLQQDSSALDNIRLRLYELYADAARLTVNRTPTQLSVRVTHPAFGDRYEDTSS